MEKKVGVKYFAVLGIILVSLGFLFPNIIAGGGILNPDIYKTHEIHEELYYNITELDKTPYPVPQPRPPDVSLPRLSKDVTYEVLKVVDVQTDGEMDIVIVKEVNEGHYVVLVAILYGEEISYFKAMVIDGNVSEAVEIKPVLLEKWVRTEVIAEYEDVTEENATAKIVGQEVVEISEFYLNGGGGGGGSVVVVEAYQVIQGKNIFGWVLWELKAGGYFYVVVDYYVYDVIDNSSAWAQGWLGWHYEDFMSDWTLHPWGLHGEIEASAEFHGPLQVINAWAWIRVYYDLTVIGDAGTY